MTTESLWSDSEADEPVALINTTPLVDVMLVLLIIFLITIPVVNLSVPVELPRERNHVRQAQADTVVVSVDAEGRLYWFDSPVADTAALARRLAEVATRTPQPEVHVRGDQEAQFAAVSRVLQACKQAGITQLSFITEPPARP